MGRQDTIRLAIVAADAETRLLLGLATECDPRYDLVGDFCSLRAAVPALLHQDTDVVIVDRIDEEPDGAELLARLRVAAGRARVVVVTRDEDVPYDLLEAAGADAFLEASTFTCVGDALQLATGRLHVAA